MKHDKDNPQWTDKDLHRAENLEGLPGSLQKNLVRVDAGLVQRLESLTAGVDVDLDAALPDDE